VRRRYLFFAEDTDATAPRFIWLVQRLLRNVAHTVYLEPVFTLCALNHHYSAFSVTNTMYFASVDSWHVSPACHRWRPCILSALSSSSRVVMSRRIESTSCLIPLGSTQLQQANAAATRARLRTGWLANLLMCIVNLCDDWWFLRITDIWRTALLGACVRRKLSYTYIACVELPSFLLYASITVAIIYYLHAPSGFRKLRRCFSFNRSQFDKLNSHVPSVYHYRRFLSELSQLQLVCSRRLKRLRLLLVGCQSRTSAQWSRTSIQVLQYSFTSQSEFVAFDLHCLACCRFEWLKVPELGAWLVDAKFADIWLFGSLALPLISLASLIHLSLT